jgi:hypothetical protein
LPALFLNYFGQGALLLSDPQAIENPFYLLAPGWLHYPMVAFATMATIIASQAIISGAYSLTQQAIQLGFLPRMRVLHTASREKGQIYVPIVNWLLAAVIARPGRASTRGSIQPTSSAPHRLSSRSSMTRIISVRDHSLLFTPAPRQSSERPAAARFSEPTENMGISMSKAGRIQTLFLD